MPLEDELQTQVEELSARLDELEEWRQRLDEHIQIPVECEPGSPQDQEAAT